MELISKRFLSGENSTISKCIINNILYYVLEDKDRGLNSGMSIETIKSVKIKGKTAIPTGRYEIKKTYSTRFKRFTLELLNVNGFGGIRCHAGNSEEDTDGCLLFGKSTNFKSRVFKSVLAISEIEEYLFKILETEKVYITIC